MNAPNSAASSRLRRAGLAAMLCVAAFGTIGPAWADRDGRGEWRGEHGRGVHEWREHEWREHERVEGREFRGGRVLEVYRPFPPFYRPAFLPRERFYRGFRVARFYGPVYPGFGFFYNDAAAWAFLGFTAWELAYYRQLNEAQLRAHEAAIVEAAGAPINDRITWYDGGRWGSVTPLRDGRTADGRACREFQQTVTIDGRTQEAFGTACQEPDGSWRMVGG